MRDENFRRRKRMTNKKKVLHLIIIYILIIQTFLLCDMTLFDSVLTRDFKQNFLNVDMSIFEADRIVGVSVKNVGSGFSIYEYNLPFGKHLYLTQRYNWSTDNQYIDIRSDFYLFKGALLPIIMVFVAVLLVTCYRLREKRRSAAKQTSGEAKLVTKKQKIFSLIILYVAVIEGFIVCDLFWMNGVFCRDFLQNFINYKTHKEVVIKMMGQVRDQFVATYHGYIYDLPFGKQILYTTKNRIVSGIYPDPYFLRGAWIPSVMGVVAIVEFACYHLYEKRKKRLKSDPSPMDATE